MSTVTLNKFFHIVVAMPGYMPESEVTCVDGLSNAIDVLLGELERTSDGDIDYLRTDVADNIVNGYVNVEAGGLDHYVTPCEFNGPCGSPD